MEIRCLEMTTAVINIVSLRGAGWECVGWRVATRGKFSPGICHQGRDRKGSEVSADNTPSLSPWLPRCQHTHNHTPTAKLFSQPPATYQQGQGELYKRHNKGLLTSVFFLMLLT